MKAVTFDDPTTQRITRCAQVLIALMLVIAAAELRSDVAALPERLSWLRFWPEPEVQQQLALGTVYEFLHGADRLLPREASVLLLTSGRDVRHREYMTFHRALYFLTPRPVWWLAPAPSDSTWESRWWISAPLTRDAILEVANARGATHLLVFELPEPPPVGQKIADLPGGAIFTLSEPLANARTTVAAPQPETERLPPLWPLRLSAGLLAIVLIGRLALAAVERLGLTVTRLERAALSWTLGAGFTSVAMFWLNTLGVTLGRQAAILSLGALGGCIGVRWVSHRRGEPPPPRQTTKGEGSATSRTLFYVMIGLLGGCLLLVTVTAVGRPLTVWDSWVLWGMRARTMYLEDGISSVVYADPSRAVTLLDYPLLVPSLEAWIYAWVGAADDRLAGTISIFFFAALPALAYSALVRRGANLCVAVGASIAVAALPALVRLAGAVFADMPVALFAAVAAMYLVEWLEYGEAGTLIVAALSAGFLPWTKREGVVVVAALVVAVLTVGRFRRDARIGALAVAAAAALFSGPWYVFVARYGLPGPQFEAVTLSRFVANFDRLPSIAWRALETLASPAESWVWPAAGVFFFVCGTAGAVARPSALLLLAALLYLSAMLFAYLFSAYVPYQQHMANSFPRIVAQVSPLPLLWIAYHATRKP